MNVPDGIVVGASAGGVVAMTRVLAVLKSDFRPAMMVVVHLPAGRPSGLDRVLGARCALPVREALDKERIESGTVYLAPPDYHLLVEPDRSLALSVDDPVHYSRPSIDVLFESAAAAYREALLAIVLTGASEDGAAGLAAVRACGGQAWVQDPDDAEVGLMPRAALERAGADATLSLDAICRRLGGAAWSKARR
jgi:two-component system chemotaxis response regulator CheB